MSGRVFVCTTCDRYAPAPGVPTPGERLAAAMRAAVRTRPEITVRSVECLNNCRQPCTAALRAPGKAVIRFGNVKSEDIPALFDAAGVHAASAEAQTVLSALPPSLRVKVSGVVDAHVAAGGVAIAA